MPITPSARWIAAVVIAVGALALLGFSVYLRLWGGIALLAVAAAAFTWYRLQVQRGEESDQFFGDFGEETRLTAFQAGSPSEMPVDAAARARGPREHPRSPDQPG